MAKEYKYVSWDKKKRRKKIKRILRILLLVAIVCVVFYLISGRRLSGTYANGVREITFNLDGTWSDNLLGSGKYVIKRGYIQFSSDLLKGLLGSDVNSTYSFKKGIRKITIDETVFVKIKGK